MFKLTIEEKSGGRAMMETKPRFAVKVNGREVSELYFNTKGYQGYLRDIRGRAVDVGERAISAFKKEARRINKEAAELLRKVQADGGELTDIQPTISGRTVQLTFATPDGEDEKVYVERRHMRAGLELFGREGLRKAYFDEFHDLTPLLQAGGANALRGVGSEDVVLAAMPTERHGIYAVVTGLLPEHLRKEAGSPFSNAHGLLTRFPDDIHPDACRVTFVNATVPGTAQLLGNLPIMALPEEGTFNEPEEIFAPQKTLVSQHPAILMDPTEEAAFGDAMRSRGLKVAKYPEPKVSDTFDAPSVGGGFGVDEIAALKAGDIFYECQSGHNMELMVVTAPIEKDGGTYSWEAVDTTRGCRVSYMWTEGLSHYGPRIYSAPQYVTVKHDPKSDDPEFIFALVGGRELRQAKPEVDSTLDM